MPILNIKNLSVVYGNEVVLDDISFSLEEGDVLAIIGPNGSGKTTLFKAILGILPYKGKIEVTGNARIGYVPQKLDIERDLPITVEEFLLLKKQIVKTRIVYEPLEVLKRVHMREGFLEKRFSELSSGELQRVLVAWALIDKPNLLLFDEPTASVDIAGQETIYELLHDLYKEEKFTLLLISHDLTVMHRYANKALCLNKAQICFGIPKDVTPVELEKLYGKAKLYTHTH